jgi:hypothetical protein
LREKLTEMTEKRRFWPLFWDAARRSPGATLGSIVLTAVPIAVGFVFWLVALPSWAVFIVMLAAVFLASVVVYHVASLAWMAQADALTKLQEKLQAVSKRESLLDLGAPKLLEHGVLRRTQLRGPIETSIGTSGPPSRISFGQRPIRSYRIPVTNHGAYAQEVRVKVVEISPGVEGVSEDVTLHVVHDNPPLDNYRFKSSFSLAKGETELLDVVAMDEREPKTCYLWNIAFEDADAVQEVKLGGTHTFTIRAYAGDVSAEARYRVYADAMSARLEMEGPLT